jgi:hypothetical protein
MATKVAVIYYSATGNVYKLAQAVEEGAKEAGAEVRFRKVRELAPEEAIKSNQGWSDHALMTEDVPEGPARGPRVGRRLHLRDADALRQRLGAAQAVHRHDGRALVPGQAR